MLEAGRLEQALSLAESTPALDASLVSEVRARSGFARLECSDLEAAADLLLRARIDPRELICLWPGLLPARSASAFVRAVPPLHQMADAYAATGAKADPEKKGRLDGFLAGLLQAMRTEEFPFRTVSFIRSFPL